MGNLWSIEGHLMPQRLPPGVQKRMGRHETAPRYTNSNRLALSVL